MKFACSVCRNIVDKEDVIIDFIDVGSVRLAIKAYCPSCWEMREDKQKKASEGGFWRRKTK